MKRKIIEQYYKNRELNNYKLQNVEDILSVHGINVLETKGYKNLTDKNKELFKSFIVNFYNAWGLEVRSTIYPISIHYVCDIEHLGKENDEDDYYVVIGNKILIMKAFEDNYICSEEYLKNYKNEDYKSIKCIETEKKQYLRFDYKIYDRKEWQHVITPTEWY